MWKPSRYFGPPSSFPQQGVFRFQLRDVFRRMDSHSPRITLSIVDDGNDPPNKIVFGSLTTGIRATASSMLLPRYTANPLDPVQRPCRSDFITVKPLLIEVRGCSYGQKLFEQIKFDFAGNQPIHGQWQMSATYDSRNNPGYGVGQGYMAFGIVGETHLTHKSLGRITQRLNKSWCH